MNNETKQTIPLIMDSVINTCWAILPGKLSEIMAVLQSKNNGIVLEMAEQSKQSEPQDRNYSVKDGVVEITIHGTLSKRIGMVQALSGGTSYQAIQNQIRRAESDPDVKGIFYNYDSPGGNVDGLFTTADMIFNTEKPSLSFADGLMASAACIMGSGADYVVASDRSTEIGSLGVVSIHLDKSKKYEKEGIKPTVFSAGRYKADGNSYEPLSDKVAAHFQDKLDYMYTLAIDTVARNRNVSATHLIKLGADTFIGEQAINAGLVDSIMTKEKAVDYLHDVIDGNKTFDRKPAAERHRTSARVKEGKNKTMSKIQSFDLKSLAESIQSCKDIEALKALEDACLLHFAEKAKSSENWIEDEKTKSTNRKVTELADIRRRQILALPQIQQDRADYELGRLVGQI